MTRYAYALCGSLLLGLAAGPALALTPQEEATLRDNCSGDYMRLCAMHAPDSPQVEQCFQAKMKDLSQECRTAITAFSRRNPGGRR